MTPKYSHRQATPPFLTVPCPLLLSRSLEQRRAWRGVAGSWVSLSVSLICQVQTSPLNRIPAYLLQERRRSLSAEALEFQPVVAVFCEKLIITGPFMALFGLSSCLRTTTIGLLVQGLANLVAGHVLVPSTLTSDFANGSWRNLRGAPSTVADMTFSLSSHQCGVIEANSHSRCASFGWTRLSGIIL